MPAPYIPEHDVHERLPDGRRVLVARAGVPMPYSRAVQMGLVKRPAPAGPVEVKEAAPSAAAEPAAPASAPDATEAAAELAAAHGIDLATVRGTGAGGKIIKSDVEALLD